ncbi:MAG: guanylate kinase [Candidatus Kapaibacteriota bacterium]
MKKFIVFSSPSGGGKSTFVKKLLADYNNFILSVSATTRTPRQGEIDGVHYYFMDRSEFQKMIENGQFIEWEEIFGNYYGTPISEIQKVENHNKCLLFDIDVKGALSIKTKFPNDSLLFFIAPPSIEQLVERLRKRNTETEEQLAIRLERANYEMSFIDKFDHIIINDDLEQAYLQVKSIIDANLSS